MPNHKLIVAIRILQVGLAALSIKLLTSSLPLAEIAKYGIVVSLAGMGTTAISSPVTMFIYRNANAWRSIQKLRLAVNFYVALILVCSICSLIVAIPISMFLESINLIHGKLFYITIILFATSAINWGLVGLLNNLGLTKHFLLYTISTVTLGLMLSFFLIIAIGPKYYLWILGVSASQAFMAGVAWYKLMILDEGFVSMNDFYIIHEDLYKNALKFIGPLTLVAILAAVLINWYRWIPLELIDLSLLGIVIGCFIFSNGIFNAVEQTAAAIYQPVFYQNLKIANGIGVDLVWLAYARKMNITLIISFGLYISTVDILAKYILAPEFHNMTLLLILCGIADFLRIISNIMLLRYDAQMRTKAAIMPMLVALISLVIIIFIFSSYLQIYSILAVSIVVFIIYIIGHLIRLSETCKIISFIGDKEVLKSVCYTSVLTTLFILSPHSSITDGWIEFVIVLVGLLSFGGIWLSFVGRET